MGKIEILEDRSGRYKVGSVVSIMDFISDYLKVSKDYSFNDYIVGIPMPSAVGCIAEKCGINYKFV